MPVAFQAKNKNDSAELLIYDAIGSDRWGDGITAKMVDAALKSAGNVSTLNVRINSPGGSVDEGNAIYNILVRHKAKVIVDVDGFAASVASVIAMAGDEIRVAQNGYVMVHDPFALTVGTAEDHDSTALFLRKLADGIADVYAARTKRPKAEMAALMKAETWMSAQEAVAGGFATSITPAKEGPQARWSPEALGVFARVFKHAPAALGTGSPASPSVPLPSQPQNRGQASAPRSHSESIRAEVTATLRGRGFSADEIAAALALPSNRAAEQERPAAARVQSRAPAPGGSVRAELMARGFTAEEIAAAEALPANRSFGED